MLLQRETVSDFDWPTDPMTVNSPFPIAVLVSWIRKYPVTPLDSDKNEVAYDRNEIEPYRLGCMWSGSPTNIDKVAQTFLAQSADARLLVPQLRRGLDDADLPGRAENRA